MDKIAVIDFGGQYAHLIANRIRRFGVYTEILDPEVDLSKLREYKGIILSGGPASVRGEGSLQISPAVFTLGVPILGICYGHQLVAFILGGEVEPGTVQEYGQANVQFSEKKGVFADIEDSELVWMSHFDQVVKVPEGFEVVASTEDCPIAAMADYSRNIYCMQFHPEVTHTPCGKQILENFVDLTDAKRDWNMDVYLEQLLVDTREHVGNRKVFLMISGGVDSTVAFMLLEKALGKGRVYGLFVDTGFMRLGEREEVETSLRGMGVEDLHVYDAGAEYFEALKGVYEPEAKRKIIGDLFLDIQAKVSEDLNLNPDEWILGQGTIYPDTIETGGTKHAHTIKTHHNRVEKIQKLIDEGKVVEPLSQLYKDEVRALGEKLGLKHEMIWRHPFPGPGLAVRCLCAKGEDYPEGVTDLEAKMDTAIFESGYKVKVLPIKSVGVQGDERTYRHPAVIYGQGKSWDELGKLSTQLTNQFHEVNRVLLGLSTSDFSSLTIHNSYLSPDRILLNQKADKVVMDFIYTNGMDREIWQFPTVLLPLAVGAGASGESIVLRPVCSTEAMTANFYHMEFSKLDELVKQLKSIDGISAVFYDITNKPPATIEWE